MGVPERDARHGALREVASVAVVGHSAVSATQTVIVEQPLTITIAGDTVATTMRTPGDDRFLALGFLFAEGVLSSIDDVGAVFHCGRTDRPDYGDTLEVVAAPGARLALERAQRIHASTSACGLCGRERIDELLAMLPTARDARAVPAALLARVPALLTSVQPWFERAGGSHAACAVRADGSVAAQAEDVGRHNAVDKVVGRLLYARALPDPARAEAPVLLAVSARAGFEIVQKAAMAGFACVASVSAPSSLAIEAAEAAGVTLASFVRPGRFTLYAHAQRVLESP